MSDWVLEEKRRKNTISFDAKIIPDRPIRWKPEDWRHQWRWSTSFRPEDHTSYPSVCRHCSQRFSEIEISLLNSNFFPFRFTLTLVFYSSFLLLKLFSHIFSLFWNFSNVYLKSKCPSQTVKCRTVILFLNCYLSFVKVGVIPGIWFKLPETTGVLSSKRRWRTSWRASPSSTSSCASWSLSSWPSPEI